MHQPDYRDPADGRFLASWVYLHALKDYTDMAAHLESCPDARATIDFTPVLLEQLEEYVRRLSGLNHGGAPVGDRLLDALAATTLNPDQQVRRELVTTCLQAQRQRMIARHPPYQQLVALADIALQRPDTFRDLDDRFVFDLLVWYHLAWMGESVRDDAHCARLIEKGRHFDSTDRATLLALVHDQLSKIVPRYRALAEQGRIELATVPYAHPLLPLLITFDSARETQPNLELPAASGYPGGAAAARHQLVRAQASHRSYFGQPSTGCWSPEAAISEASLDSLAAAGFRWTVSSQGVLRESLGQRITGSNPFHRPYRLRDAGPVVFFRDDRLSDRIGFVYKDWNAHDAVSDLVDHLITIAREPAAPGRVVVIALDGENPWEHYEANGAVFLSSLYAALAKHPWLELTTLAKCIDDPDVPHARLEKVVAGSWVHGTLDTWIGGRDKNRAWDMLVNAKRRFDRAAPARQSAAERQLRVCEGSDWFWWLDEYHAELEVGHYEHMFRAHLSGLYRQLGCDSPEYLRTPLVHGSSGAAPAPAMLPHTPT